MRDRSSKIGAFIALILLVISGGCGGGSPTNGGSGSDLPVIDTQRTRLVENGARPIWTDGQNKTFIFAYKQGEGPEGVHLGDLNGSATALYEGSQNHDYIPSPDGSRVAFSTPGVDGHLVIVTLATGDSIALLPGGRHPAWKGNDDLIAETEDAQIVQVNLATGQVAQIAPEGSLPATTSDGMNVVYYRSAGSLGLRLMWQIEDRGSWSSALQIASQIGTDVIFSASETSILLSVLDTDNQSVVTRFTLAENADPVPMLTAALRPAMSGDGEHLYANRISSSEPRSLWHTSISSGDIGVILDASFAAPESQGRALLAESDWGIERITF